MLLFLPSISWRRKRDKEDVTSGAHIVYVEAVTTLNTPLMRNKKKKKCWCGGTSGETKEGESNRVK